MDFKESELGNGLTVITETDPALKAVAVNWVGRFGARHEKIPGTAHFTEHMVSSSLVAAGGKELGKRFNEIAPRGNNNWRTGYGSIRAYAYTMARHGREVIKTIGRTLTQRAWPESIVERERSRVLMELKETVENNHARRCMLRAATESYPAHAFANDVIGTRETITALRPSDLAGYMEENFHARRMALVVCGPMPHEEVRDMAEAAFGALPAGTARAVEEKPVFQAGRLVLEPADTGGVQHAALCFPAVDDTHPLCQATSLMVQLYHMGLVEDLSRTGAAYITPGVFYSSGADSGDITLAMSAAPGAIRGRIAHAFHLARQPEKWLTEEKWAEHRLAGEISTAFNATDPRYRTDGTTNYFNSFGMAAPTEKWDELNARVTLGDLKAAWTLWDRSRLNVVSIGPSRDVPSPQELAPPAFGTRLSRGGPSF
jgi:predicted Zn-dependent peptidase